MKVTIKDLLDSKSGFVELLENKDLPVLVSYRINKLIDEVNSELEQFEKQKNELIKKYGEEKTVEGKDPIVEVKTENIEKYFKDVDQLVNEEIILKYEPFNIAKGFNEEDITKVKVSLLNQRILEKFFTGWEEAVARIDN